MWIVKLALNRPYTFIILALLILIMSPVVILRTPTDIFPNINIPVVAIAWQYTGLNPEEMEGRLTTPYEKALTTLVDNIEHTESTTYNGVSVVKVFLQPGASLDTANAQVTAASQYLLRQLPPGVLPPEIINFSASSVPILQLGISGKGLDEQQLADLSANSVRPPLVTVPGAVVPLPYGGKQRQISVNMDQARMQSKGVSPGDILSAMNAQNVVMPSGTAKIGSNEYDVRTNAAPRTLDDLSMMPVKRVNGTIVYLRDVATVSNGSAFQTNIVRQDGRRGVLISILKAGNASTLERGERHTRAASAGGANRAAGTENDSAGRPERLCARRCFRCDSRGYHCGRTHRPDDPALSGQLAVHAHHRGFDSAFDSFLGHRAQPAGRNDQHHDAGRAGAGGRHPGGRRDGHDRKHRALS